MSKSVKNGVGKRHATRIDLADKSVNAVLPLLQQNLATMIDLALQAKQAHWNVKGPSFIALHELFDDVHDGVREHVDVIAERITTLGGTALGRLADAAGGTVLKTYPANIIAGEDHVHALADALAAAGKLLRASIDGADDAGDKDTADLFTAASRAVDKLLWMVEAHVQDL